MRIRRVGSASTLASFLLAPASYANPTTPRAFVLALGLAVRSVLHPLMPAVDTDPIYERSVLFFSVTFTFFLSTFNPFSSKYRNYVRTRWTVHSCASESWAWTRCKKDQHIHYDQTWMWSAPCRYRMSLPLEAFVRLFGANIFLNPFLQSDLTSSLC